MGSPCRDRTRSRSLSEAPRGRSSACCSCRTRSGSRSSRRHRTSPCVATPLRLFTLAATSPSALRRPPTPGRLRLGPSRALPRRHPASLELPPFYLRKDLDEQGHDDTGPQCVTERIQQVGHQSKRLRRWRRSEQVAADMGGQANHEADRQALVQEPLPVHRPTQLPQVLAHPGEDVRIAQSRVELLVRGRAWNAVRSRSPGHGPTSCQPVQLRGFSAPGRPCMLSTPRPMAPRRPHYRSCSPIRRTRSREVRPLAGEVVQPAGVAMRARPPSRVRRPRTAGQRPPVGRHQLNLEHRPVSPERSATGTPAAAASSRRTRAAAP